MLYDSHTHLNEKDFTDEERAQFIADADAAAKSGLLTYVNDVAYDMPSSFMAIEHAEEYPWCYAIIGVHPADTPTMTEADIDTLRNLAKEHDKVVAIGEIGLDFHYEDMDEEKQLYWFRRQIQLANELHLPIAIHSRDANQLTMDVLKEEGAFSDERKSWFPKRIGPDGREEPDARVLLHCFSGSRELGRQYVALGATLSMAGPVTFKNNRRGKEVAEAIPIQYLLVETDAPYLAPEPMRGRQNCPAYVEHTCRKVAELKGISFEEAAEITLNNAVRFFNIK